MPMISAASYLRYNHVNRNVYGALLSYEFTPELSLNTGYTRQENNARGVLCGSLPLICTNGTRVNYPASASTSAPLTYWNVTDQTAFAELEWKGQHGWQAPRALYLQPPGFRRQAAL